MYYPKWSLLSRLLCPYLSKELPVHGSTWTCWVLQSPQKSAASPQHKHYCGGGLLPAWGLLRSCFILWRWYTQHRWWITPVTVNQNRSIYKLVRLTCGWVISTVYFINSCLLTCFFQMSLVFNKNKIPLLQTFPKTQPSSFLSLSFYSQIILGTLGNTCNQISTCLLQ